MLTLGISVVSNTHGIYTGLWGSDQVRTSYSTFVAQATTDGCQLRRTVPVCQSIFRDSKRFFGGTFSVYHINNKSTPLIPDSQDRITVIWYGNIRCARLHVVPANRYPGVHLVLFCICFYVLFTRRNRAQIIILLAVTFMFALATADLALSYRFLIHDVPDVLTLKVDLTDVLPHIYPKSALFVTNKCIFSHLISGISHTLLPV